MSGHSKWKNIMHKKEKTDAQRAKMFTKFGREIAVAVRDGGSTDPNSNSRLKDAIAKAKANNVPSENIERLLKRLSGSGNEANYENIIYEGYGPAGVAVVVEALTDNRNRTAGEMRHYFDKYGGNLGQTGSVSWMFSRKGVIVIEQDNISEDKLMEDVLEAGAVDFASEDDMFEVFTDPQELGAVRDALEKKGYSFLSAQEELIPSNYVNLEKEEDIKNMQKLIEMLEDNDDVQNVWTNWGNEPDED